MSIRNTAILVILVAIISAGLTRYYFPQVEYKNTETTKEVVRNDIKTTTKTIENKDGTKETITETVDNSIKKIDTKNETLIALKPQWMLDVGARTKLSDKVIVYDVQVQRRILGPFFLGARASTDQSLGVSVGMEF